MKKIDVSIDVFDNFKHRCFR